LIGVVFWITGLHDRPDRALAPAPQRETHTGGQVVLVGAATAHQTSAATEMRGVSAQDIEGRTKLS